MNHDPLLAELGDDWRRQTVDLARLNQLTDRRLRLGRLVLLGKMVVTLIALLSGIWYLWVAFGGGRASQMVAGIVMLVALPLMLLELRSTAGALRIVPGDTPIDIARRARDQATAAHRLLWGCRVASALLAAGAAALVMLYAFGRASAGEAFGFGALWLGAAILGWLWQRRRAVTLSGRIRRSEQLLDELQQADA